MSEQHDNTRDQKVQPFAHPEISDLVQGLLSNRIRVDDIWPEPPHVQTLFDETDSNLAVLFHVLHIMSKYKNSYYNVSTQNAQADSVYLFAGQQELQLFLREMEPLVVVVVVADVVAVTAAPLNYLQDYQSSLCNAFQVSCLYPVSVDGKKFLKRVVRSWKPGKGPVHALAITDMNPEDEKTWQKLLSTSANVPGCHFVTESNVVRRGFANLFVKYKASTHCYEASQTIDPEPVNEAKLVVMTREKVNAAIEMEVNAICEKNQTPLLILESSKQVKNLIGEKVALACLLRLDEEDSDLYESICRAINSHSSEVSRLMGDEKGKKAYSSKITAVDNSTCLRPMTSVVRDKKQKENATVNSIKRKPDSMSEVLQSNPLHRKRGRLVENFEVLPLNEGRLRKHTIQACEGDLLQVCELEEEARLLDICIQRLATREQTLASQILELQRKRSVLRDGHNRKMETLAETRRLQASQIELLGAQERSLRKLKAKIAQFQLRAERLDDERSTSLNDENEARSNVSSRSLSPREQEPLSIHGTCEQMEKLHVVVKVVPIETTLPSFWEVRGNYSNKLASFIPCVNREELLLRILDLMSNEIIVADKFDSTGWHRRESILGSILDLHLLLSTKPCRSEVTGRDLKHTFDPFVPICPYELEGTCNDEFCPFQHIEKGTRPRELLPLPIFGSVGDQVKLQGEKSPRKRKTRKALVQMEISNEPIIAGDHGDFSKTIDYILLPKIIVENVEEEEEHDDYLMIAEPWWDQQLRTERLQADFPHQGSLLEVLRYFNGHLAVSDSSVSLTLNQAEFDAAETLRLAGESIDLVRLTTHSGRFDLANAIIDIVSKIIVPQKEKYTPKSIFGFFQQVLSILNDTSQAQLMYDADEIRNPFLLAFEAQLKLSLLSLATYEMSQPTGAAPCRTDAQWKQLVSLIDNCFEDGAHMEEGTISVQSLVDSLLVFAESDESTIDIRSLTSFVSRSREVCKMIKNSQSISTLTVVEQMIVVIRDSAHQNGNIIYLHGAAVLLGYSVFGSLENAASNFALQTNMVADSLNLYHRTDNALRKFRSLYSRGSLIDLLICPLFAANSTLGCALRLYSTVYTSLLNGLQGSPLYTERTNFSMMAFSELMWSQLLQLHCVFPSSNKLNEHPIYSKIGHWRSDLKSNQQVARFVKSLGIHINHLTLENDWNLVAALSRKRSEGCSSEAVFDLQTNLSCLLDAVSAKSDTVTLNFAGCTFQPRFDHLSKSTLPQSLLLAGTRIIALDLRATRLSKLPESFGHYFPKVKEVNLSDNELRHLPDSIAALHSIEAFFVQNNELAHIPEGFGPPTLVRLNASSNRLSLLPRSLEKCTNLQFIYLHRNPLKSSVWTVLANFRNLREITPSADFEWI